MLKLLIGSLVALTLLASPSHSQSGPPTYTIDQSLPNPNFNLPRLSYGMVFNGNTWDRLRTPNIFKTLSSVTISSETTIWTPASGKKFRLMGWCITQGTVTGAITIKDNTGGTTILIIPPQTIATDTC